MSFSISLALLLALAAVPRAALAAAPSNPAPPAKPASPLAPRPKGTPNLVVHAPYEGDSCTPCHARDDAANPGKVAASMNDVCIGCHTELEGVAAAKHPHAAVEDACTNCHNPHNATAPKLLLADGRALCAECHAEVVQAAGDAPVQHRALTTGAACVGCHDPHGSSVKKLLRKPAAEMCLACHDRDGMKSADGRPLTDMKRWLAQNAEQHSPVASGDCSSCHQPHGGKHFRLLTEAYPAAFYADFDEKSYALCFSCHDGGAFRSAQAASQTSFRDGDRNLHFLHVNAGARGRTCRACHDVHASTQAHHIRESVPFGKAGWALKLHYTKTAEGGSCAKTCHATRTYSRGPAITAAVAPR
jgi:predicted CXXCH cytochrome family protein